jgi:hypothetical protein
VHPSKDHENRGKDGWNFVRQREIPSIKKEQFHAAEGHALKSLPKLKLTNQTNLV